MIYGSVRFISTWTLLLTLKLRKLIFFDCLKTNEVGIKIRQSTIFGHDVSEPQAGLGANLKLQQREADGEGHATK